MTRQSFARRTAPTDVYQRSEKKSHLDTIWYEIAMLEFCHSELGKRTGMSEPACNLFIEGFLLHYRNIIEFCSGGSYGHADCKARGNQSLSGFRYCLVARPTDKYIVRFAHSLAL